MKDHPRQQFRWAPHVSGTANVRPKDYEQSDEVEAENEYAAWALLLRSEKPLQVGDLLEIADPDFAICKLRICKYVGFEEAQWVIPEAAGTATISDAAMQLSAVEIPQARI